MSHKFCPTCKQDKLLEEFGKNSKRKDQLQNKCKECRSSYMKKWYEENSELQKSRSKASKKYWFKIYRDRIVDYLKHHPCIDCGNDDIEVLEFDHRIPEDKKFNLGECLRSGYGWTIIEKEIAKCDVRCANCHRKKTRRQLGWWVEISDFN